MPKAKKIGAIVAHVYDDDSKEEINITAGEFSDTGGYVHVSSDGDDAFYFRPESWPLIRDEVDRLMKEIAESE